MAMAAHEQLLDHHFSFALPAYASHYLLPLVLIPIAFHAYQKIIQDYHFFLSLGPGGTPSTPAGYIRICLLRMIARRDVLTPPAPLSTTSNFQSYFKSTGDFPTRQAPRPKVAGIAPHRQMTQRGTYADVEELMEAMRILERNNDGLLKTGKSCFEKHSLALFLACAGRIVSISVNDEACVAKTPSDYVRKSRPCLRLETRNATCGAPPEIAHLHGSDGSLHMTLHPSDAKVVIENGWGERHPLAGRGTWVPSGFMMIYAPRNRQELEVVVDIMRAGCWWVSGIELSY